VGILEKGRSVAEWIALGEVMVVALAGVSQGAGSIIASTIASTAASIIA